MDVNESVKAALHTAHDLGVTTEQLVEVGGEVADLLREGIVQPSAFDPEKVRRIMDLAIIGLLHEKGYIP